MTARDAAQPSSPSADTGSRGLTPPRNAAGAPAAGHGNPPSNPLGWRFTAPLLLGSTLNPINSSMMATALVGIGADFRSSPGATAGLISVLYLCSAVAQPTMGKLSVLFGPRRVFLSGVAILLLAGVVGVLAPNLGVLLISRALIGIGTSACYPTAMALVRRRADESGIGVPGRVLGNFSIAAQVTAVVGLPLGGVLAGAFGWRALFALNIPLALLAFTFTLLGVAKDAPVHKQGLVSLLTMLDLPGIALFAGAIVSLLVFLSALTTPAWWLAVQAVVLAGVLLLRERHAGSPLIDVRMLGRNGPLQRTYLRTILAALATYASMYGTSQWMEQSMGLNPAAVGLILIPLSLLSIVVARVVSSRAWVRWPLILAGVALTLSAGVMLLVNHRSGVGLLIGMTLLLGLTNGFSSFANQAALYLQTTAAEIAVASGLLRTSMYLGAIGSSSLIGIAFGPSATDAGFHTLAWILVAIGASMVLLTACDRSVPAVAAEH
ncbi:MFS transporter [Arthrobacter bambusae]|uniref:MFS family arabinose efflux permease n=1 Tax=Arthrobacter bambusae TaxID=1338426 RepID=A0AAW8DGC2_9MICC|nr:MFS transporter [Arthrobacter bambusae]MDP9904254.1 putative MFS family arabinose efflux permease [Arthrobacter bambusae]MDQ0127750.1 putative MFS family arabinose efflux permease [Arthrobacter bambusae]MDQ0179093.1 putative MFS family arabinose efflux permease [Arthrobacter bambusae]